MKNLRLAGVILLSFLFCFHSKAQITANICQVLPVKANLFSRLPERFDVNNLLFEKLFTGPASGSVRIPLAGNAFFEGTIIEKVQQNENVSSINIKSSNYDGALLTLSKIVSKDRVVTYVGRILSIHYGDVLILRKEGDQFSFVKIKQSLVVVE